MVFSKKEANNIKIQYLNNSKSKVNSIGQAIRKNGVPNTIRSKLWNKKRLHFINRFIGQDEIVLEVGCGNRPIEKSTILLDKFISPTSMHRSDKRAIHKVPNIPFILGDGNKLPFKDKSVDTIICRQVIEHVEDPVGFIMELQRVGRKGYVEWPSLFVELLRGGYGDQKYMRELFIPELNNHLAELYKFETGPGTPGHKWFILSIDSCLYILPKSKEIYPLFLMYVAHAKQKNNNWLLSKLLMNPPSFCTWLFDKKMDAVILQQGGRNDVVNSLNESYNIEEQIEYLNKSSFSEYSNPMKSNKYQKIICCPECKKGNLRASLNESWLNCENCYLSYPVVNGVPIFITQ